MYGWINDAIEKLIVFRYGEENWAKIKAFGQCDVDQWVINREYPDYLTDNLITAACEHLKEEPIDRDSFLVELGEFFLLYVRSKGYDHLMLCQGSTFKEWLSSINDIHAHLQLSLGKSFGFPEIYCTEGDPRDANGGSQGTPYSNGRVVEKKASGSSGSMTLYYKSKRATMMNGFFLGMIKEAACLYFDLDISAKCLTVQGVNNAEFTSWKITSAPFEEATPISQCNIHKSSGNLIQLARVARSNVPSLDLKTVASQREFFRCPFSGQAFAPSAGLSEEQALSTNSGRRGTNTSVSSAVEEALLDSPRENIRNEILESLKLPSLSSVADDLGVTAGGVGESIPRVSSGGADAPVSPRRDNDSYSCPPQDRRLSRRTLPPFSEDGSRHQKDFDRKFDRSSMHSVSGTSPAGSAKMRPDGSLNSVQVQEVFPYHFTVDHDFRITNIGRRLRTIVPGVELDHHVSEYFKIVVPSTCGYTWTDLKRCRDSTFELEPLAANERYTRGGSIKLSGSVFVSPWGKRQYTASFFVQPDVRSLDDMVSTGLTWSDFPKHSAQPNLILLAEHLKSETYQSMKSRQEAINTKNILEMKRIFVRYVSHEIRTPLNTACMGINLVQTMKEEKVLPSITEGGEEETSSSRRRSSSSCAPNVEVAVSNPKELFEMTEEIKESCEVAVSILNDLLIHEKLEGRVLELERKCEPAVQTIRESLNLFSVQARQAKLRLDLTFDDSVSHTELETPSIFMHVDKLKISQVVRNLVSNAIRYSKMHGGDRVEVCTSLRTYGASRRPSRTEEYVRRASQSALNLLGRGGGGGAADAHKSKGEKYFRIDIRDTGPGITLEDQARLFENIVQFDPSKLQGGHGTGLGLFIAKGIVDLHGGLIGVHSDGKGHGAIFFIEVPAHSAIDHCSLSVEEKPKAHPHANLISPASPRLLQLKAPVDIIDDAAPSSSTESLLATVPRAFHEWRTYSGNSSPLHMRATEKRRGLNLTRGSPLFSTDNSSQVTPRDGHVLLSSVPSTARDGDAAGAGAPSAAMPTSPGTATNSIASLTMHSAATPTTSENTPAARAKHVFNVLVVDDSAPTRKMLVRYLKLHKLCDSPTEANDGLKAVNIVKENLNNAKAAKFDCILMDFVMPEMDGPTATKAIRALGFTGAIVGITGNVLPDDREHFMNCGANAVMAKPVDMMKLKELLCSLLYRSTCRGGEESSSRQDPSGANSRNSNGQSCSSSTTIPPPSARSPCNSSDVSNDSMHRNSSARSLRSGLRQLSSKIDAFFGLADDSSSNKKVSKGVSSYERDSSGGMGLRGRSFGKLPEAMSLMAANVLNGGSGGDGEEEKRFDKGVRKSDVLETIGDTRETELKTGSHDASEYVQDLLHIPVPVPVPPSSSAPASAVRVPSSAPETRRASLTPKQTSKIVSQPGSPGPGLKKHITATSKVADEFHGVHMPPTTAGSGASSHTSSVVTLPLTPFKRHNQVTPAAPKESEATNTFFGISSTSKGASSQHLDKNNAGGASSPYTPVLAGNKSDRHSRNSSFSTSVSHNCSRGSRDWGAAAPASVVAASSKNKVGAVSPLLEISEDKVDHDSVSYVARWAQERDEKERERVIQELRDKDKNNEINDDDGGSSSATSSSKRKRRNVFPRIRRFFGFDSSLMRHTRHTTGHTGTMNNQSVDPRTANAISSNAPPTAAAAHSPYFGYFMATLTERVLGRTTS